jgi:hypothetical protein
MEYPGATHKHIGLLFWKPNDASCHDSLLKDIVQVVAHYCDTACQILNGRINLSTNHFDILQFEITRVRMQLGRDNLSDNFPDVCGVNFPNRFDSFSTVLLSRHFTNKYSWGAEGVFETF